MKEMPNLCAELTLSVAAKSTSLENRKKAESNSAKWRFLKHQFMRFLIEKKTYLPRFLRVNCEELLGDNRL